MNVIDFKEDESWLVEAYSTSEITVSVKVEDSESIEIDQDDYFQIVSPVYSGDIVEVLDDVSYVVEIEDRSIRSTVEVTDPLPRGESAFEVAVRNGYEGTEEEWLETLKGDYVEPKDGVIEYSEDGVILKTIVGDEETLFNYDIEGNILSITKPTYTKQFTRSPTGSITGWVII